MALMLSALRTGRVLLPKNIIFFNVSSTLFCERLSESLGLERSEGLGNLKEFIHLIESRTRDIPAYSIVP
jgi:hypothetical protein